MYKFTIYVSYGFHGFTIELFAKNADEAITKAKSVVAGEQYIIQGIVEIREKEKS